MQAYFNGLRCLAEKAVDAVQTNIAMKKILMSKHIVKIESEIAALFAAEPDNAFTAEEICKRIFPGLKHAARKRRVEVLKAARNLMKREGNLSYIRSSARGHTVIFFKETCVISYAMACQKRWPWRPKSDAELRARLSEGGEHFKDIQPGGAWWRHTQMRIAKREGDVNRFEELRAEQDESLASMAAAIRERF
jgi:hypothetical protein